MKIEEIIEKLKALQQYDVYGGRDGLTDTEESDDGYYILVSDIDELIDELETLLKLRNGD